MDVYKVTSWGSPVGHGVSGSMYLHLSAIGKTDAPDGPYCVANELVAAEIGKRIRLPIPPFCVVQDGDDRPFFASLDFNLTGLSLPPVIPPMFQQSFPNGVADIVVFDIFIANSDRHHRNLSADYSSGRYNLFDHSHCLLGGSHHGEPGSTRLSAVSDALVIDGRSGGNRHCLLDVVADDRLFERALRRVESLESYFLEDIVDAVSEYGLSESEASQLLGFLSERRFKVRSLISSNKSSFKSVRQWSLL